MAYSELPRALLGIQSNRGQQPGVAILFLSLLSLQLRAYPESDFWSTLYLQQSRQSVVYLLERARGSLFDRTLQLR